jgi:hypothetical protein
MNLCFQRALAQRTGNAAWLYVTKMLHVCSGRNNTIRGAISVSFSYWDVEVGCRQTDRQT